LGLRSDSLERTVISTGILNHQKKEEEENRSCELVGQFILDNTFPFTYHTRTCGKVRACYAVDGELGNGVTHHARSKIYV
jgi:hypothetical protein